MDCSLNEVIELSQNRDFSKMVLVYDGSQEDNNNPRSHVYRIGDYCIKYYVKTWRDCEDEEKNLNILDRYGFAPKLFFKSQDNSFIIMEYIWGTALGKLTMPLTLEQKKELGNIKEMLDRHGIYYEKEKVHCIIENSGRVRFIDFGL